MADDFGFVPAEAAAAPAVDVGFIPESDNHDQFGFVPDGQIAQAPAGLIAKGATYGPIVGETHHDAMFGPLGNALAATDVALSPDYQKHFPLGSFVMANGKGPYRVADSSFHSPGKPNTATIEFRDTAKPPENVSITPATEFDLSNPNFALPQTEPDTTAAPAESEAVQAAAAPAAPDVGIGISPSVERAPSNIPAFGQQLAANLQAVHEAPPIVPKQINPLYQMGREAEAVSNLLPPGRLQNIGQAIGGGAQGIASAASSLTTPENIGIAAATLPLGGTGVAAKVAQTALAAYFEAQAIHQLPQQWEQFKSEQNPARKAEILTGIVTGLGLPIAGAAHVAFAKEAGVPVPKPEPVPQAEVPAVPTERIASVAIRNKTTGVIVTGANHTEAFLKVHPDSIDHDEWSGLRNAVTSQYEKGFLTSAGRFVPPKEANGIALRSRQISDAGVGELAHWDLVSHPTAAIGDVVSGNPTRLQRALKALDMTREDLLAIGAVPPGTGRTSLLIDRGAAMVSDLADVLRGKIIPRLTKAGVMDEAVQHANARQYVPALVEELQAKVFPTKYKDMAAMQRTLDVVVADNILGGYDDALALFHELENVDPKLAEQQKEFIDQIAQAQDLSALDAKVKAAKGTDIEADIHLWEQQISPLMDSLYNEIKGVDPNTPRETRGRYYGARMNLLPEHLAVELAKFSDPSQPMPEIVTSNYRNPNVKRDRFMRKAALTGSYSTDPNLVMLNSFAGRWNEVTKLRFYAALVGKGVAELSEPGLMAPKDIGGEPVGRMPIKIPETGPSGKTQTVEKNLFVQKRLVPEIRNVLDTDGRMTQNVFFKALTQVQLLQLADASAHLKNIHSVVVNMLGNTSMGRDLIRKFPGIGSASAVTEIVNVSREIARDTPAIRSEIADLTKRGMIRPDYPSTGLQRITRMQALIHDVDTAARIIMNRRFDNLVGRDLALNTPENRRNFVQQIGEYNRRLMTRNEAMLRDYGLSPFIVAGRTFNRFSRRLVTGSPGFETATRGANVAARTAQISGLVVAATLPAIINSFTTGSMGGRDGTPVGAIDFGPSFDTSDGKHRTMDLLQLTGIRRGLRGTGIEALVTGLRDGKTWNQIAGDAAEGIISTSLHPFIGPGVGGIYQTLTGKRIDLRTGWKVDVPQARKVGGAAQFAENARVALKSQNPFLYGIVQNGLTNGMDKVFGIPAPPDAQKAGAQILEGAIKAPLSALGYKEVGPQQFRGVSQPMKPAF